MITKDKALIGSAGVHFVVFELSLRDLIALPTVRNTAGIDVVVVNKAGTWQANIQVKTSRSRVGFWPISANYEQWRGPNNFYIFLRYNNAEHRFEAFAESSIRVITRVKRERSEEIRKGLKPWAPCFYLRNQADLLARQWQDFGPGV